MLIIKMYGTVGAKGLMTGGSFSSNSRYNLKIVSYRLPTHRYDANIGIFFYYPFLFENQFFAKLKYFDHLVNKMLINLYAIYWDLDPKRKIYNIFIK